MNINVTKYNCWPCDNVIWVTFLDIYRLKFLIGRPDLRLEKSRHCFWFLCFRTSFAFGWTPCIGPQLGAILSLAASNASLQKAQFYWPFTQLTWNTFLLFAIFINRLDRTLKFLKGYFKIIERVMGLLLWTVGC